MATRNLNNAALHTFVELAEFSAYNFTMFCHYFDIGEGYLSGWFNNPDGTTAYASSRWLKNKNLERFVNDHRDFNISVDFQPFIQ